MEFRDLCRFCITLPCFHSYEKPKVLNDIITLEFVHGLLVKISKIQLNWASYALVAHEKHNALQIMRQVVREKKTHLQPVLLEQAFGVTQPTTKSLNVFAGSNLQIYLSKEPKNYKLHNHQEAQRLINHLHLGLPSSAQFVL